MGKLRVRWLGVALLLVVLAGVAAWLGAFLSSRGLDWAAKFSEIASLVLAAVGLLPPLVGKITQWAPPPKIRDEQVDQDANALAAALRAQGRNAAVHPGVNLYDRLPMPVRWAPAPEVLGIDPGLLKVMPPASADYLSRTFDDVLEFFRQLSEPRLVVLGEAGAGKTVLATELARRLLSARESGGLVPVIVPVTAWDPVKVSLFDWIAGQLERINADLAQVVNDGRQLLTRAQVLLDRMKILPILDGLDEVEEVSRPMATLAINRYGWSQPLVVTCRYETYMEIIGKQHGTPVARAAVIKLLPLEIADIKSYLGSDLDACWTAIYSRLDTEPQGALAQVLTNPLMLWLAWTIYSPPSRSADELADQYRFGNPEAIEHHLLAEFVPALYPESKDSPRWPIWRRPVTVRQAERWLGFLASDSPIHRTPGSSVRKSHGARRRRQLDTFETRDIQNVAWWRFTEAAGVLRVFGVVIRAALLLAVLWQVVLRVLSDNDNWRGGKYVGHLPFQHVFLNGPLGQVVWPSIYRLLRLVPTATRNNAFVTLNNAFGNLLMILSDWPFLLILALPIVAVFVYTISSGASRPRRVNIRPMVLIRWLFDTLVNALLLVFVGWSVLIYWHHSDVVTVFFSSRTTWLAVLVLSLAMSIYRWPARLVSEIDVVGATDPPQSLRADNRASIFLTVSRRVLFAVTLALLCGPEIVLIYSVYAVASTVVLLVLGGLMGYASRAYTDACIWLAISRRLPWRSMSFLKDAERRGVFQEVGAIYRFRHTRVQLELRDWYQQNRFRLQDGRPRLQRLLNRFSVDPALERLQSKANSYRELARPNPAGFGADLTVVLGDLATTLRNKGRLDEELQVRGEIVAISRAMVTANPGMSPHLAASLESYSQCLAESGREYEALGVMSEAADVYGRQAAPQRRAFQSRLADWLYLFPFQAGRRTLAHSLMTEVNRVTDIYRDLVLTEPEPHKAAHGRALILLAGVLRRHGCPGEAATTLEGASQVYRDLIKASAGISAEAHAHETRTYAQALSRLATGFEQLGLSSKAADAVADAVQVYRGLAQAAPDKYRGCLAGLLTRLANLCREQDRPREMDALREAASLYREAAEGSGEHRAPSAQQADAEQACRHASVGSRECNGFSLASLSDMSLRLWKLGDCDAAVDAARTGRQLAAADGADNSGSLQFTSWVPITDDNLPLRPLPQSEPRASPSADGNRFRDIEIVNHWRRMADKLDTRAFRFLVSGQVHESLAASIDAVRCSQQAVEIQRELAETWPSAYLGGLAETLEVLAGYLHKLSSRECEAENTAREADEIRRRLQGL